ncbi:MAG: hypothetical protein IJN42_07835, partial [Clostridia bacterium]|nr:hypothetical protein [Clostridia bacterium]
MNQRWIAAWGCPITRPTRRNAGFMKDVTLRMNFYMTVSGSALRFHFSNLFGDSDATISAATVSVSTDGSTSDAARM